MFYLPIHLLIDIIFSFRFWLVSIKLLYTLLFRSLCEYVLLVLLGKYLVQIPRRTLARLYGKLFV